MKRGFFRRKSYEEVIASQRAKNARSENKVSFSTLGRKTSLKAKSGLKRGKKMAKASKLPISKLQRQIWEECKRIIRAKYGNVCYTCGKGDLVGGNWQTGHMFAKASVGAFLKYDLRILRPQCYFCNINCGGRGADFVQKMREIEGNEYVDQIYIDKRKTVSAYDYYCSLLESYRNL